ncbi:amino acid adenylation domain-containing protein [Chamaesiphon sp. VAR_48_metabat_135_sub]|uniref:non-ribosomal peptide synthetase n=1 Tax=Chamaesiphon sp. VAR_48_metabat_135_sub TaxID=2964699 RepID=UPI00286B9FE2|nr:amino acid adenylation domain-containing protein [Chamaesiphon sp. VAR_48_metabat_135_sub]
MSINQILTTPASQNPAAGSVPTKIELAPFQHPYLPIETAIQTRTACQRYPISLAHLQGKGYFDGDFFKSNNEQVKLNSLLSIFAAYCARLSPESEFDLGLKIESPNRTAAIFRHQMPIRIQIQPEESFRQFRERLEASLDLADRLSKTSDTIQDDLPSCVLPVTIVIADRPDRLDVQDLDALMTFVAYEDGSLPELVHAGALTQIDSEAIVRQLQSLILACVEQPEQPLGRLPLLSTVEQQQLLIDWNQTQTPFPTDVCIHQLFEQQVAQTPNSIAVACESQQLTYRELNDRANQLAHYLLRQGVQPDTFVGLQMERSIDMVVGLLAIHKAGGAYLPLDPDFPADRLALMLADSQAPIILTQQRLIPKLAIEDNLQAIAIDTNSGEIAQQPATNPQTDVNPTNLGYIIYTSGSTGKPKGVMVEHRNAVNFFTGMDARIDCHPGVWLAVTSLSFDISVLEIFWTLTRGFKVVIYNAKTERTQGEQDNSIAALIDRHQVTHLQCTPSMASLLIGDLTTRTAIGQIQTMMVGGEALTEALALQLQQIIQGQVHNMYGPTETTIWSTTYPLSAVEGVVPLGKPIANTELYILDKLQQPVPIGIAGELLIGGKGVTRGYLNRPDLTQERFIPNPFNADPTARLYRTGDLVRYRSDGNLEFLGRIDFQVKIRGYRIELGEIETILGRHETIREVAIVVREDVPGDKRLVAYFVPQPGQEPTAAILRTHLRSQLPEYMVPSNFIPLQAFPLTPNNKVDRKAFPAPLLTQQVEATAHTSDPHQPIEQNLIEIWQKILQIEAVDITDNFFDLGGHSLVALELFAQIERIWNKRLFLSILFQSPTIAELANIIRQSEDLHAWSPLVLLASGGEKSPLFCIHPVGGNVLGYYDLAKIIGIDRPVYGLQARGINGEQQPFDRIEDMANYFIEAIQTVQSQGPYFLLGYSFGGIIAFDIARQLTAGGAKVAFLGLLDLRYPGIKEASVSFSELLTIQLNTIKELTLKQQIKYIFDKIFKRRAVSDKDRYRDEVVTALSDLETFTPELLSVLDCNWQAAGNYQPQVYQGTASLFWSDHQLDYIDRHPDLGWGDLVAGDLDIEHIPGDHNTLMKEPNVRVLAEKLKILFKE